MSKFDLSISIWRWVVEYIYTCFRSVSFCFVLIYLFRFATESLLFSSTQLNNDNVKYVFFHLHLNNKHVPEKLLESKITIYLVFLDVIFFHFFFCVFFSALQNLFLFTTYLNIVCLLALFFRIRFVSFLRCARPLYARVSVFRVYRFSRSLTLRHDNYINTRIHIHIISSCRPYNQIIINI